MDNSIGEALPEIEAESVWYVACGGATTPTSDSGCSIAPSAHPLACERSKSARETPVNLSVGYRN
jgi:hypothetical protein